MNNVRPNEIKLPDYVVSEPTVELAGYTKISDSFFKKRILPDAHYSYKPGASDVFVSDGEILVEFGGRSCYQSFHNPAGRTNQEYIQNIIAQQHYSVLRHASATFYLEGVSRAFTHELARHHHHDPSQLSQRYVDQGTLRFVMPSLIQQADDELKSVWIQGREVNRNEYNTYVRQLELLFPNKPRKEIREAARSVMPECTETKILVTANCEAWRGFLQKRWNKHADAEMQAVSERIATDLKKIYPYIFEDITYQEG